jgi:cytochrome P450
MSVTHIDLGATDLFATGECFAAFKWLREHAPVYWNATPDGGGFWALSKYRDVVDVYMHPEIYSSAYGTMLGGSYRSEVDTASGQMLIVTDPPRHRYMRQSVHKAGFSARQMARIREGVRISLEAALDRLVADGGGDFAADIAVALPAGVLAGMMALTPEQGRTLLRLTRSMVGFRDAEYQGGLSSGDTLVESMSSILEFFSEIVDDRRERPGDDLVSQLLKSQINGAPMTEAEILYNSLNVAFGGNETTAHAASYGLLAFFDHPEEEARLRRQPELLDTAVEELFRYTATNTYVKRTTVRPVVIRGQAIDAGQTITIWNTSANYDEEVFADPDRFDVGRTPNPHVTFGVGRHHCIGASVSRLEITMLLRRLLERNIRLRPAGPVERLHSNFALGIRHLPVEVV